MNPSLHYRLLRHFGPAPLRPRSVHRETISTSDVRAEIFSPLRRDPVGSFFVLHGLHFDGPTEARFADFCTRLADAGFFVFAPSIRVFQDLRVEESATLDADTAFDAFLSHRDRPIKTRPAIFTVSFGSLLGLHLAGEHKSRDKLAGIFLFGGALQVLPALQFALGHTATFGSTEPDPLNVCAVSINAVGAAELTDSERGVLVEAWKRFARATWGKPSLKAASEYVPIAHEIASSIAPEIQTIYLEGCGITEPGRSSWLKSALGKITPPFLGIENIARSIRCPVVSIHGVEDDVIPHTQVELLHNALSPAVERYALKTGLYDHSATSSVRPGALLREMQTLWRMVHLTARLGTSSVQARGE